MGLIFLGSVGAASDATMATVTNKVNSLFRGALTDLVEVVLSDNPTIVAAALAAGVAAVDDAASTKLALAKCVHLEAGKWVWDGPNGASSTHYLIPDETGALIARATPFPFPSATAPELTW